MVEETMERVSPPPQERPKVHFEDWLGVLAHVHTQVWPKFLLYLNSRSYRKVYREVGEEIEVLKRWSGRGGGKEGVTPLQFPISVLAQVAKELGKREGGFFVIDTPHPAHSLPEYHPELFPDEQPEKVRKARGKLFSPENLESTIVTISKNLEVRRKAIEDTRIREELKGRIFTGVEADILDSSGRLDVTDEVLSGLEVVIASYHKGEWVDVNGREPSYDEILASYLAVSESPFVDVIGHPELPDEPLSPDQWKRWEEIFKNLASRGKAVEIPLSTLIGSDFERRKRLFEFLKKAKEAGVKIFFNIDFHRLQDYFPDIILFGDEGVRETTQSQAEAARKELEELSKVAEDFPTSHKEAEEFENNLISKLSEIFEPGQGAFGLPKYLTTLARPFYYSIRQLQENGIEAEDVVNGNIARFRNWLTQREIYKEVARAQLEFNKIREKNPVFQRVVLFDDFDPMNNLRVLKAVAENMGEAIPPEKLGKLYSKRLDQIRGLIGGFRRRVEEYNKRSSDGKIEFRLKALRRGHFIENFIEIERKNAFSFCIPDFTRKFPTDYSLKLGRRDIGYVDSIEKLKSLIQKDRHVCLWLSHLLIYVDVDEKGQIIDRLTGKVIEKELEGYFALLRMGEQPPTEAWIFSPFKDEN